MRTYIKAINHIIDNELGKITNYKLIKLVNFSTPEIYYNLYNYFSNICYEKGINLIAKLSKEKYEFWKRSNKYNDILEKMDDIIEKNEHLTKWRNHAFNNQEKNTVVFLMGTELVEDQGGLEDFYTISPETIERELGEHYSRLFNLDDNMNLNQDDSIKIDNIYSNIFNLIEKDLLKLSYFIEDCNTIGNTKVLITEIFNSLYRWWGLPNIRSILSIVDITTDFKKSNQILENAYKFNRRIGFDSLPSSSKLKSIERNIDEFPKHFEKEVTNNYNDNFPSYEEYDEFKTDLLNYIKGIKIDEVKGKLSMCNFDIINRILKLKKVKERVEPATQKDIKIYGDPVKAFIYPILELAYTLDEEYKYTFDTINIKINSIKLSNTKGSDNEELKIKYINMCRFLGGIESLINEQSISNKSGNLVTYNIVSQKINGNIVESFYPFEKENIKDLIETGVLESGSDSELKSKIKFRTEILNNGERIDYKDYEWSIFDADNWLSTFSILDNPYIDEMRKESAFIPIGVSSSINELIDCTNDDEFVYLLRNCDIKYENVLPHFTISNELIVKANVFGQALNNFINTVDEKGFFSSFKVDSTALELNNKYNVLTKSMIEDIKELKNNDLILRLSKACLLLNEYNEYTKGIEGAIVTPFHPVMVEKMIERYIYLSNGFRELYDEILSNDNKALEKNIESSFNRLDQLATVTFATAMMLGNGNMASCEKTFGFFSIYGNSKGNYNISSVNLDYFDCDETEDLKGKLSLTPISRYISKVIIDYVKVYPSKIDGITIMFMQPKDYKNLITGLKHTIDSFKNLNRLKMKLIVYTSDFKGRGKEYIRYWIDNNITEDDNVKIEFYMKYLDINDQNFKRVIEYNIKQGDIIFLQDIMKVVDLTEERTMNQLDTENTFENRYPAVYLPVPSNDSKARKIAISQPQFSCEYNHSQFLIYLNQRNIEKDKYRIIKHLKLEENMIEILDNLHEKVSWVVILDSCIDADLINSNKNKVIGFSTGEGYFGELNTTISANKDFLDDLKKFLVIRLRNRFINWELQDIRTASEFCIHMVDKLDGAQILKAINPNDQAINNYLGYLLTFVLESVNKFDSEKYYLRKLISLDTYSHLFDNDITLIHKKNNLRPDYLLIEIPKDNNNLNDNSTLNIQLGIIECKIGSYSDDRIVEAKNQLQSGYKTISAIWSKNNKSVQKRFWNNQLYRILSYNSQHELDLNTNRNEFATKLTQINENNYNIRISTNLFTYWLDKELEDGIEQRKIEYEDFTIGHTSIDANMIKMLLSGQTHDKKINHYYTETVESEEIVPGKSKSEEIIPEESISKNCTLEDDVARYDKPESFLGIFNEINSTNIEDERKYIEDKVSKLKLELESRKVKIYPKDFIIGPDIIRLSLDLGHGVNIEQIKKYSENMKLWLSVNDEPYIFIEDGMVKLDVVRAQRETVGMKDVLIKLELTEEKLNEYKKNFYALLGVDILGNPYLIDFSDSNTPHLLIAGQTGSGKSVLLNSILTSIMIFYTHEEVEMYLVDPKKVELTSFKDSLFTKEIATEVEDALNLLEKLVDEMSKRYTLFMVNGVRNIYEYNEKMNKSHKMKRLLMVFDEYATMMEAGNDSVKRIESAIKSLSQMARAAGIHLIICTQSPRADIITTTIRNNLTARVGLRTADSNASSLILDQKGAESLLGKGDMWLKTAESSNLTRLKSPYVSRDEINRLIELSK